MNDWISVTDQLPPINVSIWLYWHDLILIGYYNGLFWDWYSGSFLNSTSLSGVTHWQLAKIPDPPAIKETVSNGSR